MASTLTSLNIRDTLTVVGATSLATLALSGQLTLSGNIESTANIDAVVIQAETMTSATLDVTGTASGKTVIVESETGTASGYVTIQGSNSGVTGSGGTLCIEDNDGAGFSLLGCLNGTCTARAAAANECPTG